MTFRVLLAYLALLTVPATSRGDGELNSLLGKNRAPDPRPIVVYKARKIITMEAANPEAKPSRRPARQGNT